MKQFILDNLVVVSFVLPIALLITLGLYAWYKLNIIAHVDKEQKEKDFIDELIN